MTTLRGLDALEDAIAAVAAAPETLRSEWWRCGSGMCIAGHLCDRNGGRWLDGPDSLLGDYLVPLVAEAAATVLVGDRDGIHACHRAERILGFRRWLTDDRNLFDGDSTLADLQAILADLRRAEQDGRLADLVQEVTA
jgi:hypothetical protein